jgi:hypothetical protein
MKDRNKNRNNQENQDNQPVSNQKNPVGKDNNSNQDKSGITNNPGTNRPPTNERTSELHTKKSVTGSDSDGQAD